MRVAGVLAAAVVLTAAAAPSPRRSPTCRPSRPWCRGPLLQGRDGRVARCRRVLAASLKAALAVPRSELYGGDAACQEAGQDGDQWCYDAVRQRPTGGATQPLIHWTNRPTYQMANEITGRAAR